MSGSMVGGVDSSIPLQAGKGTGDQPNVLQQIGQFANIQNSLNQAKAFPGQMALQQQQIQGGQAGLYQKINQAGYQALTPLLAAPITYDNLTSSLASIEHSGLPTQGIQSDIHALGNLPLDQLDGKVRALIASRSQSDPASAVGMVTPGTGPQIDNGPVIALTTKGAPGSQTPGQLANAGAITKGFAPQIYNDGREGLPLINGQPNGTILTNHPGPARVDTGLQTGVGLEGNAGADVGLSRAQMATPTPLGVDNRGVPQAGTLSQYLVKGGNADLLGSGKPLPPGLMNPNRPGIQTGLGPAAQAQQTAQATSSNQAFQDISAQGTQARSQNAILGNMLGDLDTFTAGPERLNEYQKTLQRYAPSIAAAIGVDPKAVAANESFDKLANQIAGAQGQGTDARLAVAQNSNPGSHLSPAGANLIVRQLQGNADYLQARQRLAAQYPDQTNSRGFEAEVGQQLDPRAFQYDRMQPQQKLDYIQQLKKTAPSDLAKIKAAYNSAHQAGLLSSSALPGQ